MSLNRFSVWNRSFPWPSNSPTNVVQWCIQWGLIFRVERGQIVLSVSCQMFPHAVCQKLFLCRLRSLVLLKNKIQLQNDLENIESIKTGNNNYLIWSWQGLNEVRYVMYLAQSPCMISSQVNISRYFYQSVRQHFEISQRLWLSKSMQKCLYICTGVRKLRKGKGKSRKRIWTQRKSSLALIPREALELNWHHLPPCRKGLAICIPYPSAICCELHFLPLTKR